MSDHQHEHHHHHAIGHDWGISLAVQVVVTLLQIVVGKVAGSSAVLVDGLHTLTDVAASSFGRWAHQQSHRVPDREATYGYARYEDLSAFAHGLVLMMAGFFGLIEAVEALLVPERTVNYSLALGVASVGLAGNVIGVLMMHRHRDHHLNISAYVQHMLLDALSSVVVITALVGSLYFHQSWIEAVGASLIGSRMLFDGFRIAAERHLIDRMIERAPAGLVENATAAVAELSGVVAVHHVHVTPMNGRSFRFSATVHVDGHWDGYTQQLLRDLIVDRLREFRVEHVRIEFMPVDQAAGRMVQLREPPART